MTFKDVSIGATFRFESEKTMPYSGMMRGPWIKTGPRTYTHKESGGKYRVGSSKAKVLSENPSRKPPKGWIRARAVKISRKGGKVIVEVRK